MFTVMVPGWEPRYSGRSTLPTTYLSSSRYDAETITVSLAALALAWASLFFWSSSRAENNSSQKDFGCCLLELTVLVDWAIFTVAVMRESTLLSVTASCSLRDLTSSEVLYAK